jgi:hypothetical protein
VPPEFNPNEPYFRIRVIGTEEAFPSLLDVSSFLYDFNLLYETSRLATDPKYSNFRFSSSIFYRGGRPLDRHDRLYLQSIVQGSPLDVVVVVTAVGGAVGAVWGIVQVVEKISNARLNRRKLQAEVEKLERDNREASASIYEIPEDNQVRRALRIKEAEHFYDNVSGRLERSSVRVKELEIEVVEPNGKKESQ